MGGFLKYKYSDQATTIVKLKKNLFHVAQNSNKSPFPLYILLLSGCGGSDDYNESVGSTSTSTGASFVGSVIKGPLQGATVFLDANNNQEYDSGEGEIAVVTGPDGKFEFTEGNFSLPLVAVTDANTIDWSSGTSIGDLTLKAPSGSTVITPITTLIVDTKLSSVKVAQALGLPEEVSYNNFNPYAPGVDNGVAVAVENTGQKIVSIITTFAELLEYDGLPKADALNFSSTAMADLVKEISNNFDTLDSSSENIETVDLSTQDGVGAFVDKLKSVIMPTLKQPKLVADEAGEEGAVRPETIEEVTGRVQQLSLNLETAIEGISAVNTEIDKVEYISFGNDPGSTNATATGYSKEIYALVEQLRTQATTGDITFTSGFDFAATFRNGGDQAPDNVEVVEYNFDGTYSSLPQPILSADGQVGTLRTIDELSTFQTEAETVFSYELSGADSSKFEILDTQKIIYNFDPTSDTQKTYELKVKSTDESGLTSEEKTIYIKDHPVASLLGKVNFNQWDVSVAQTPHDVAPVAWAGSTSENSSGKILFKIPEYSYSLEPETILDRDWKAFQDNALANYAEADVFAPGLTVPTENIQYRVISETPDGDRVIQVTASLVSDDVFEGFASSYISESNPNLLWIAPEGNTDGTLIISGDVKVESKGPSQVSFSIQSIEGYDNTSQTLDDYQYAKILNLQSSTSLTNLSIRDFSDVRINPDGSVFDRDEYNTDADAFEAEKIALSVTDVGYFEGGVNVPISSIRYSVNAITSNGVSVTVTASSEYTNQSPSEVVLDNQIEQYNSGSKTVILSDRYFSAEEVANDPTNTHTTDTVKTPARDTFSESDYTVNGYFADGITVSENNITSVFSNPTANGQLTVVLTGTWQTSVETVSQYGNQLLALSEQTFLVAWTQKSLTGQDCYGQIFLKDGNEQGAPFLISAQHFETASVAINLASGATFNKAAFTGLGFFADGVSVDEENIHAVFSDPDENGNQTVTLKAAWPSTSNVAEHTPKLNSLGTDKFIVTWIEGTHSSTNIKAKIYNNDGSLSVPQFDINVISSSELDIAQKINYNPVIRETSDGFVCVWFSYDNLGDTPSMMAREFDLQGKPKSSSSSEGNATPTITAFSSNYTEYSGVNDIINIFATVDGLSSEIETAITLTLNSGAVVTLTRDTTDSPIFTGTYNIGINDISVKSLEFESVAFNTNQRLLYSENIKQDQYGDIFQTHVDGSAVDGIFNFDVSVDGTFSVETNGDKVAVVYTSVSKAVQNLGAHEISISGFDVSDANWADSFETNQTLLSDFGLTQLNLRPETFVNESQEDVSVSLSAFWEARPVLSAADTFNYEVMSQVYSAAALFQMTGGQYQDNAGLRDYMDTSDFTGLNYSFSPYKKLTFSDKMTLVDQTKLEAYLATFGTDIYRTETDLVPLAPAVVEFSQSGHNFDQETGVLELVGVGFDTLLEEGQDGLLPTQVDWSKFHWDFDGTDVDRLQFETSTDIEPMITAEADFLKVTFTLKGLDKITSTINFGGNIIDNSGANTLGLADKIDIKPGFLKDSNGNVVLERAVALENGKLAQVDDVDPVLTKFIVDLSLGKESQGSDGNITETKYELVAEFSEAMRAGSTFKAALQGGKDVFLTQTGADPTKFTGNFIIYSTGYDNDELNSLVATWAEDGIVSYENLSAVDLSGNPFALSNEEVDNIIAIDLI